MKKFILLLSVILGSLLFQSCFCEHDFFGPDYGHHGHYYHHGGPHHGW
ncbi:MAG: hypothetical protein KBT33_04325 [Prevotellaceae bacterium]|nr:hypothetical protein [Candidatus Minthosoma equi]